MVPAAVACLLLLIAVIVTHYEVLRALSTGLPLIRIPPRAKLMLVIIATFFSHVLQILLYAATYVWFVRTPALGAFKGIAEFSVLDSVYFSAETFTSLGFGDIVPSGPLQLIVGSETLIGLLLMLPTLSWRWSDSGRRNRGATASVDFRY